MAATPTELTVQGQSLQQLYTQYSHGYYSVNRRYQRKLVWAVEEKARLIDSVVKNLPIPLVLLAESADGGVAGFEVIDGLQRLNALFAFMENEFMYEGAYFDLETLADTKLARDEQRLEQKQPILSRELCTAVANYQLPMSIYRSATEESVDEVFRRINSSGQKLSLQEIRQAGVTSSFAALVRKVSSFIRGDASLSDVVPLAEMPKISITNRELPYGILDETIFWVQNGILDRESVRESRDEELVVDLLLDMMLDPMAVTGTEYRNSAYGRDNNATTSASVVDARVRVIGDENLIGRFIATLDVVKTVVEFSKSPFAAWTITQKNPRGIPRYFHAIFIAIHELLFVENLKLSDPNGLTKTLNLFWDRDIQIPAGGGNWGVNRKRPLFDAVKASLRGHFEASNDPIELRRRDSATQFEIELNMAVTETSLFELKQGFTRLDASKAFDDAAFEKVLRTASAMANHGLGAVGRIFFGVADSIADAEKVELLHGVHAVSVGDFQVTGTEHEMAILGRNADQHLAWIVNRIRNSKLEPVFAQRLASSATVFRYRERLVWSLEAVAASAPVPWDGRFFIRIGNSTEEVSGVDVVTLMSKFLQP